MIENASVQQSRSCTEIFFEEWGTSARKRPTVRFLLDLLVKAELFRGADYVAEKLLNGKFKYVSYIFFRFCDFDIPKLFFLHRTDSQATSERSFK